MKRSLASLCNRLEIRKLLQLYMSFEFTIWTILSYSAIYYGKIFDYRYTNVAEFSSKIDANLYYSLMFGHLNLTQLGVKEQQEIQGKAFLSHNIRGIFINFIIQIFKRVVSVNIFLVKCDMMNTLFVFVFGTYWILIIFFIAGLSKVSQLIAFVMRK